MVGRGTNIQGLIEENFVHDSGGGEGIGSYFGTHVLIRGNTISESRYAIYFDGGHNLIAEQNKVLGGTYDSEGISCVGACTTAPYSGVAHFNECLADSQPGNARYITMRNNLIAGIQNGLSYDLTQYGVTGDCSHAPVVGSARIAGNTVINASAQQWFFSLITDSPTIGSEGIDWANNFYAGGSSTGNSNCSVATGLTRRYQFSRYSFSDSDCAGTGDVVSATTGITSAFSFGTADKDNIPSYTDFRPTTDSAAYNAGVSQASETWITAADWTWARSQSTWEPCGSSQLSSANWAKTLYADYCNATRTNVTMGALNAVPP
jgi:hypothetical protein